MAPFLFFLLLFVALVPGLEQPGHLPRLAVILVGAPLLWTLAVSRGRPRGSKLVALLLALTLLIGGFATLRAEIAEAPAVLWDLMVIGALGLIAWVASGFDVVEREALARAAVVGLWLIAPIGLLQGWWGWEFLPQVRPPAATFVNRNVLAETLVIAVPLAFAWGMTRRAIWARWAGLIAAALGDALLITTRARGAWIAAGVAWGVVALWVIWRRRARGERWIVAGVGVPLAVAALIAVGATFAPIVGREPLPSTIQTWRMSTQLLTGTGAVRAALARNTLAMIGESPLLGVGPGRWPVVYPLFQQRVVIDPLFGPEKQPEHTENDLLEYAAELGLPWALLLLGLIVGGLWRTARDRDDPLAAGRLAALAAVALLSLVSFPLHSPTSAAFAFALVGIAWRRAGADRWPRWAALLGVLFAVGTTLVVIPTWRGQAALGRTLEPELDCAQTASTFRLIAEGAPWSRRELGLAAALVFHCDDQPGTTNPVLERALAANPNQLNLLLLLAARRVKAEDGAGAAAAAHKAVAIAPRLGRAWLLQAMAQDLEGRREEARVSCEKAVQFYGDGSEARIYCGGR